MKILLIFTVALAIMFCTAQASFVDQSQDQFDSGLFVICNDWLIAQTFTAGISGQLEKVDLYLTNIFGADLYPCTVSIVDVLEGVPSGSVLGQFYASSLVDGLNSIDFLSESVFLTVGTQYGIVIANDDEEHYSGTSTQWRCKSTDIYTGGSAWSYMPNTGWTQTVQPPEESSPVETFYDKDAAFTTHVVPEPSGVLLFCLIGLAALKKRKSHLLNVLHR